MAIGYLHGHKYPGYHWLCYEKKKLHADQTELTLIQMVATYLTREVREQPINIEPSYSLIILFVYLSS